MYKGNMRDFCNKVLDYVNRKYSTDYKFYKSVREGFFFIYSPAGRLGEFKYFTDCEDLEEKVYEIINQLLKEDYVQR